MPLITYCDSVFAPQNMIWIELSEFLEAVRDCRFKGLVDKAKGDSHAKRNLPAIAFSTFTKSVANSNLLTHSGYFHFDIDNVTDSERENIKCKLTKLPYTYALWQSPNGGLKGLLRISVVKSDYEYKAYFKHFESIFDDMGIVIDKSCKDVRRYCYVSYDVGVFVDDDCETVRLTVPPALTITTHIQPTPKKRGTVSIDDRLNTILHNCRLGQFHAMRYKAGVIIGGLISGGQADESLIDVYQSWSDTIHSTFGDSESVIRREVKTFADGLEAGRRSPIYDDFLGKRNE